MRLADLRVGLGLDWGNASPGCVVFAAALPNGHVHIFDEYKFQRMTAKDVAAAVKDKCSDWGLPRVPSCACDPSLLPATTGEQGEWIGLTLMRHGLPVHRVSNDRVNGWQRVHEALAVDPITGTPWLTVHPRCKYLARTLPLMVQSRNNPEDLDSDSDDHACLVAGTLVATERGDVAIESVTLADRVWTPEGLRPVFAVAMTDADAETWTVRLEDGRTVRGTANHPIMGAMNEQIRLDALRYGDILTVWPISHGVIEMRGRNGGGWWGRFLEAFTSTTGTGIRAITRSRTSSACLQLTTRPVTRNGGSRQASSSTLSEFVLSPSSGIAATRADRGTVNMARLHGGLENLWRSVARCADAAFRTSPYTPSFAPITANLSIDATPVPIWSRESVPSASLSSPSTSTTRNAKPVLGSAVVACSPQRSGRGKVYNLTVDGGVFFANGILTHNCDATRYLLMGGLRPDTGRRTPAEVPAYSGAWWRKMSGNRNARGVLA